MKATVTASVVGDPAAILDRHGVRRAAGVPTVSVLVGPAGAGGRIWRRWAADAGRSVVIGTPHSLPIADWIRGVAGQVDLPAAAVQGLARRAGRDPEEFFAEWQVKTPADRKRFWDALTPDADDNLLRAVAELAAGHRSRDTVPVALSRLGEAIVPVTLHLAPSAAWPSILFIGGSAEDFSAVTSTAVHWATRVPAVSVAVAVPAGVWDEYLATASDSRTKALLREGEVRVPVIDGATVERTLREAGAEGNVAALLVPGGADAALVEAAVAATRATAAPPATEADDDHARSAAERFLFTFLESLPETAGRFELNAALDFRFGPRPAEVDLLCRSPRIAVEVDGYFHFLGPEGYRRDRAKDWELQRRGFLVLRFLAGDVIPQLETVRGRILDALTASPPGAHL